MKSLMSATGTKRTFTSACGFSVFLKDPYGSLKHSLVALPLSFSDVRRPRPEAFA